MLIPHVLKKTTTHDSTAHARTTHMWRHSWSRGFHCFFITMNQDGKAIVWTITCLSTNHHHPASFQQARVCEFDVSKFYIIATPGSPSSPATDHMATPPIMSASATLPSTSYHYSSAGHFHFSTVFLEMKISIETRAIVALTREGHVCKWDFSSLFASLDDEDEQV
jgi:hypothetical protein